MRRFLLQLVLLLLSPVFLFAQQWETNASQAMDLARKEHKPVILVFQGSDWCAPCIRLDHEIWSSETFRSYAADHFIMLKADFPRKKKNALPKEQEEANARLAEKYNEQGIFPLVVVLDENGKVLGKTGYKKVPPEEYITLLESFK
jgi:thioredoxin-related protein